MERRNFGLSLWSRYQIRRGLGLLSYGEFKKLWSVIVKSSGKPGKISSGCEIANISPFGLWVLVSGHEYFLDHKRFPWFKGAAVEDVLNVESPRAGHLRWPALDVDLHLDSIDSPEQFPLVARPKAQKKGPARKTKRSRTH